MDTLRLRAKADKDGKLTFDLPTVQADTEYEIVIGLQPTSASESDSSEIPPPGTGARMAYEAQRAGIRFGEDEDASTVKAVLRDELGDYLLSRMQDDDEQ